MVQFYALIMGVVLMMLGLVGLLLAEGPLFSALSSGPPQDALRLAAGLVLIAAGSRGSEPLARVALGGVGMVYRLLGVLGAVNAALFGLLPDGYTAADTALHLIVGGLAFALAWGGTNGRLLRPDVLISQRASAAWLETSRGLKESNGRK